MRLGSYYRAQILKHFNIKAGGDCVLDVGCYDGYWLSTQKAKNKYALDLNINKLFSNIHYIKASALNIPFNSNYFDQVFAFDVLEHVKAGKEQKFLDELIRVCKEGGEIILSTPSKSLKMFPGFMTNYISRKWGHDKCNGYSKEEFKKMFSTFGNIKYQILDNNALSFRLFFIAVRPLWFIWQNLAKKIVNKIAFYDCKYKDGDEGFYIIKILKNNINLS